MIRNFALLTVLAILFSSCIQDPEDNGLFNIDSEFNITLSQQLTPLGSELALEVKTLFNQECSDNIIVLNATASSSNITLNIDDIVEAGNCEGSDYVASRKINFDVIDNGYEFKTILRGSVVSNGTIIQTPKQFLLNMSDVNGILVDKTDIQRIPLGYFWGTISAKSNFDFDLEESQGLLSEWDFVTNGVPTLASGDYSYFEIDHNNSANVLGPDKLPIFDSISFVNTFNGDEGTLQSIIDQLRNANPQINIHVMDSTGKTY